MGEIEAAHSVLLDAADVVGSGAWTQGAIARDADGNPCAANDPTAVAWCAQGAVLMHEEVSGGMVVSETAERLMLAEVRRRGFPSILAYNDAKTRTASEVEWMLRIAAARV